MDEVAFSQIEGGKSLSYRQRLYWVADVRSVYDRTYRGRKRGPHTLRYEGSYYGYAVLIRRFTRLENLALTIAPMDKFVRHTSRYFSGMPINPMTVINRLRQERTNFEDTLATEATRNVHLWDKLFSADQKTRLTLWLTVWRVRFLILVCRYRLRSFTG